MVVSSFLLGFRERDCFSRPQIRVGSRAGAEHFLEEKIREDDADDGSLCCPGRVSFVLTNVFDVDDFRVCVAVAVFRCNISPVDTMSSMDFVVVEPWEDLGSKVNKTFNCSIATS